LSATQIVHTHVPLSPSGINLVPVYAGKVIIDLALHYGLTALGSEVTTSPMILWIMAQFTLQLGCKS